MYLDNRGVEWFFLYDMEAKKWALITYLKSIMIFKWLVRKLPSNFSFLLEMTVSNLVVFGSVNVKYSFSSSEPFIHLLNSLFLNPLACNSISSEVLLSRPNSFLVFWSSINPSFRVQVFLGYFQSLSVFLFSSLPSQVNFQSCAVGKRLWYLNHFTHTQCYLRYL